MKTTEKNILVTGGLGFIGSHTCVELLNQGHKVIVSDNLSNSEIGVKNRIREITGRKIKLYTGDLTKKSNVEKIFQENKIDIVIHFAGFKAVGESVKKPIMYYSNNLISTINLIEIMKKYNCKNIIFSSSATIYGDPGVRKYTEDLGRGKTTNPYGETKSMIEQMLEDLYASDKEWSIGILRYFNPIGAHESGLIGEKPNGIPNNLMPYILKVANGELPELNIFGNDYDTYDGTGVRDYIHVVDLAKGHVATMNKMENEGLYIYNLGSGKGSSVLDIVNTFERVNKVKVNYKIVERRDGDLPEYFADPQKALNELGWKTEKTLEDMCRDSWHFIEVQKEHNKELELAKDSLKYINKLRGHNNKEKSWKNY